MSSKVGRSGPTTRLMLAMLGIAVLIPVLLAVRPTSAHAQARTEAVASSDTTYEVRLRDGSLIVGTIVTRTADGIVLLTSSGVRMTVPLTSIREMRVAAGTTVDGEYWSADPNLTRLFFAPTARAVGHQKGYVGTYLVLLPFVGVGIGNHLTLAGGAPLLFGELKPVYIAPKVTLVERPNGALAIGTIAVLSDGSGFDTFGVVFGMATRGSQDKAVTVGVGFGYSGDDISGEPAIMVGGESRVSRRVKLITENYFIGGVSGGFSMVGARILGERLSVDVGVGGVFSGSGGGCCLPIVNFAYGLGR